MEGFYQVLEYLPDINMSRGLWLGVNMHMNSKQKHAMGMVLLLGIIVISVSCASSDNIEKDTLQWTKIGAMGSWAGSVFGAIALIVALIALFRPQMIKMKVEITSALAVIGDGIQLYSITVKNTGIKPFTVNGVYFRFGNKKNSAVLALLPTDSIVDQFNPKYPKCVNQGESFNHNLIKVKTDMGLKSMALEHGIPMDAPLYIGIDEAIKGRKYFATKYTLETFAKNL